MSIPDSIWRVFKSFIFAVVFMFVSAILTAGDKSMPVGNIILISLVVWWLDYELLKIQTFINHFKEK